MGNMAKTKNKKGQLPQLYLDLMYLDVMQLQIWVEFNFSSFIYA